MANNIERLRGKHGISQTELAKKIGCTKQSLNYSEHGHVTLKTAQKISEVLGENLFKVLGTDSFVTLPKTEEEKDYLINLIKEL